MAADEDIERFHFNNDGTVFAVETNKAVYTLEKI